MASSSSSYLLFLVAIIVSFLSISGIAARPCKTFLISSYSLSITPENPNLESDLTSSRFVTVFTIRRVTPHRMVPFFVNRRHGFLPSTVEKPQIQEDRRPQLSFPFISENINSFRDRTRDILSVVVALLFGVGCGALTAATMYLVWALVVNRHSYDFEEDDYENDESDAASLKKLGYVKIPAPAPVKTGMIILGGGLPKHHICNANMMRNGADYAVFINTGQEFDGSDSGARPDEAVSWGKIRGSAKSVKVYCDATIAFPLLVAETFASKRDQTCEPKT